MVEYIMPFKTSTKLQEITILDDTLANVYAGLLVVQTFSRRMFFKWVKNYHLLLLSDVNLRYLRNQKVGQ